MTKPIHHWNNLEHWVGSAIMNVYERQGQENQEQGKIKSGMNPIKGRRVQIRGTRKCSKTPLTGKFKALNTTEL